MEGGLFRGCIQGVFSVGWVQVGEGGGSVVFGGGGVFRGGCIQGGVFSGVGSGGGGSGFRITHLINAEFLKKFARRVKQE